MVDSVRRGRLIREMIGTLAKAVFNSVAKCLASLVVFLRPKNSFQTYIDDTKKFRKELKELGLTSQEDLKKAIEKSPNLPIKWKNY